MLIDRQEKVLKKKNLLMQLFRESGIAKAPAVLNWLGTFLDDRLSGKVRSSGDVIKIITVTILKELLIT